MDSVRFFCHSSLGPCNYRFLKFIQQAYTYFQVILLTYFMLLAFSHEFTIVLYNSSLKTRSCEKQHFVIHSNSFALVNTENTQLNDFLNLEKDIVHEIWIYISYVFKKPQLNHTLKYVGSEDENIIWKMAFWNKVPYETTYICPASVSGSDVSLWLKRHLYGISEDGGKN